MAFQSHRLVFALTATLLAHLARAQSDAERDIKSKDPEKRVAAIEGLKQAGGEKSEKLLISALLDQDWEVIERAALALRDIGTKAAVPQLAKIAIDAPARRMRLAAAQALAKIDPEKATESLGKLTAGKSATHAWDALAVIAPVAGDANAEALGKNLEKSQKGKDVAEQRAAAGALACAPPKVVLSALETYLGGKDIAAACYALHAAASKPKPEYVQPVVHALGSTKLDDVLERRAIAALCALAPIAMDNVKAELDKLASTIEGSVASRAMRVAAALASVEVDGQKPLADAARVALGKGLAHADANVRCAALHAGGDIKDEATLKKAHELTRNDSNARARLIALREVVRCLGMSDAEAFKTAVDKLNDKDALVREEAAVALGASLTEDAAKALEPLVRDAEWTVAACAAVSLGKTRDKFGLRALKDMARETDWKRRGAAIVGLCHITKAEAIPTIIQALEDAEPAVGLHAWSYLKALSKQDLERKVETWQTWWTANGTKMRMWTPEEIKTRREKYGYAGDPVEVFRDLDVVVIETRAGGDRIQDVLERVRTPGVANEEAAKVHGIPYRLTHAAKHAQDGLPPSSVYISNCPGEIETADVERVAWFLRTGGYLFGSCWSLHETIEKVYPGVVRKFESKGEVSDTVVAEPCAPSSQYLKGVFEGGVEPEYNLEGAHLIEVIDRERCEVLVDSPLCATTWGNGNMTVWFRAGHGLVLDSVNHFDNQGLTNATSIKEVDERQAYALDHMGLSYKDWRHTRDEKWWSGNAKAAAQIYDRTALDLVTNVVRSKRLEEL